MNGRFHAYGIAFIEPDCPVINRTGEIFGMRKMLANSLRLNLAATYPDRLNEKK